MSTRTSRAINLFDTGHSDKDLKRRNGHVAYMSTGPGRKGLKLTYDLSTDIGKKVIGNNSFFYVVSTDCGCNDPVTANTTKGKLKIGISVSNSPSFAQRLHHYQKYWGDSCYIHCLILFKMKHQAKNFEAAVKRHTIRIPENGANVQNGIALDHDRIHERFSLQDIVPVLDAIDEVRQRPYWKKETEPPKKSGRT